VQFRHFLGGLDVDFNLVVAQAFGGVARDVGEALDVFAEFFGLEAPNFAGRTAV
jgi:hypothetical protein